ncbi:hypothetical protein LXL04_009296 [Taraxacum kok-saghyz]
MSSDDKPEIVERGAKKNENEEDEESTGFLGKLKGFVQDIGEKIEGTIGFGKPIADVSAIHIPKINLKQCDLIVVVLVTNPNPIPIPLIDIITNPNPISVE